MSHFRLHTKTKEHEYLKYLILALVCLMAVLAVGYTVHSIGTARARSRETVLIYTEEEFNQYLVDRDSEEFNLNGNYQLEEDLDLSGLKTSIGSNIEPFTGRLDGNGHVISRLARPLFGVTKEAEIEQLFLSEAEILYPFTYYDGEHYVDGYGALAAYAIDSTIRNCGMGGDIYTATPSEASYQIAKASPADALEETESEKPESMPSAESPEGGGNAFGGEGSGNGVSGGPGMESQAEGETERQTEIEVGPGVETDASEGTETESADDPGPGVEPGIGGDTSTEPESGGNTSAEPGSSEGTSTEAGTGGETSTEGGTNGGSAMKPETGTDSGTETGATGETSTEATGETSTGAGSPAVETSTGVHGDNEHETGTAGESKAESENAANTAPATEGSKASTETEGKKQGAEQDHAAESQGDNSSKKQEEPLSETVGYRANERQQLMQKITAVPEAFPGFVPAGPGVVADGPGVEMESILEASPSDATPADAEETENLTDVMDHPDENPGDGNPGGDIYISVIADQIRAGGLVAETAGTTLISDCFVLATISSEQEQVPVESCAGGLTGVLGEDTRTENSYASGLLEHGGAAGGFVAVSRGTIQNCYSTMILGQGGNVRGAFAAVDRGTISDCVYDRQMASVDTEEEQGEEKDIRAESPADAEEELELQGFGVKGLEIMEMAGLESRVPGTWYLADQAYPQITYFAGSAHETIASYSRASVIVLPLAPGTTLLELQEGSGILLPSQVDGQPIQWNGKGGVMIDENNQAIIESPQIRMESNEVPRVEMAVHLENSQETAAVSENFATPADAAETEPPASTDPTAGTDSLVATEPSSGTDNPAPTEPSSGTNNPAVTEWTAPEEKSSAGIIFEATVGTATRRILGTARAAAVVAAYNSWEETAMAIAAGTLTGEAFLPEKNASGTYEIRTPEALAWFAYQVKTDDAMKQASAVLMNDIQLTGDNGYGGTPETPLSWIPIGTPSRPYQGTFDGGGHVIDHMRVEENGYAGLFACAGGGAVIKKLGIGPNSRISGIGGNADAAEDGTAALVGAVIPTGTPSAQLVIEGCYNRGDVTGKSRKTGAFVGNGEVDAPGGQRIAGCYNTGRIEMAGDTANERPGAIAGTFSTDLSIAGAGINNCYWDEQSTGQQAVTAVGASPTTVMTVGVEDANALPSEELKSSDAVTLLNESATGENYWQYEPWLDGQDYPTFFAAEAVPANWIEVGQKMYENNKMPKGTGEPGDPFQIGTPEELAWFMYYVDKGSEKHYSAWGSLTADINLTGSTYDSTVFNETTPMMWGIIAIGVNGRANNSYTGTFDGKFHTISSLYYEGYQPQIGFIGTLGSNGIVQNLYIDKLKLISTATAGMNCIAGIVGQPFGTIQRCGILSGSVKLLRGKATMGAVGGIGGDYRSGQTIDCFNRASVSTDYKDITFGSGVGGISGRNGNSTNCYNTGVIRGGTNTDGISKIGTKVNCYNLSGSSPSGGSTALSESDLKTAATVDKLNASRTPGPWKYRAGQYPDFGVPQDMRDWSYVADYMEQGWFSDKTLSTDTAVEDGSEEKPFLIQNPEQLAQFAYRVNNGQTDLCAKLTADISLFGAAYTNIAYDPNDSTMKTKALPWIPIGNTNKVYTGTFNGNGHTISLMNARDTTGTEPQGLFGTVGGNSKIMGVGIEESVIGGNTMGGIAGSLEISAEISQCYIRESTSFDCISSTNIYCGGIAGRMFGNSKIRDCYSRDMAVGGGGGAGSYAGGITGWMTAGTGIYNSYAYQTNIPWSDGTAKGSIAGGQETTGTIHQCYVDSKMTNGDQDPGIKMLVLPSQTDAQIQQQVNDLNTLDGVERTGTDRAWYTSLATEKTGGLPTLVPPEILTVAVNPADVTVGTVGNAVSMNGARGTLSGAPLPADTWIRGIRREKSSDLEYALTQISDVLLGYYKYGSDNANKNLALVAGTKELKSLTPSLTPSLTAPGAAALVESFTEIIMFNGAAYNHPTDRIILVDLAGTSSSGNPQRYELQITVKGITEKLLSVVLGTPGKIELVPGKESTAYTQDLTLENRCAYPLQVNIASVTPKAVAAGSIDVVVNPANTIDPQKSLVDEGIRLGIAAPSANDTGGIGNQKFYYTPPAAGASAPAVAKWITSQIEGNQTLRYRYFMEYSHVYLGPGNEKFGYDINYQFEIPKADVSGIQVAGN